MSYNLIIMGWKEYYERVPISFGDQLAAYNAAIAFIRANCDKILDPQKNLSFILGGFHPLSTTAQNFLDFCHQIHPNPNDKYILLDINSEPFKKNLPKDGWKIQARLEELPFSKESIDFIFLDFTLDFMKKSQVRKFVKVASWCLRSNGLLIVSVNEPLIGDHFSPLSRIIFSFQNRVPTFPRSSKQVIKLLSSDFRLLLTVESEVNCSPTRIVVFCERQNTTFPTFPSFISVIKED